MTNSATDITSYPFQSTDQLLLDTNVKLVTDDADFRAQGLTVLTANRKLLT